MTFLTDGQLLLLILWLVYYTDCFVWINKHSILFRNWWGSQWHVVVASNNFGTAWGGFAALNPFPLFGLGCISQVLPLSISPDYIVAYNTQTVTSGGRPVQTATLLGYENISLIEVRESDLWIDGKLFCKFRHQALANNVLDFLNQLRKVTSDERILLIDVFWKKRLDAGHGFNELKKIEDQLSGLRISSFIMFVYLYVILPLVTTYYGISRLLIPAAVTMFAMVIPIIVEFFLVHRSLYSKLRSERITHACKMFFCPPVSIRATDCIIDKFFSEYDILALATFLPGMQLKENFLTWYLRDLCHPVSIDSENQLLKDTCYWQNSTILRMANQQLPEIASIIESALSAPERLSPDRLSYCPRCLVQLSVKDKNCPDCSGVPLKVFETASVSKIKGEVDV